MAKNSSQPTIAEILSVLLRHRGVGQSELAESIGTHPSQVTLWLSGQRLPSPKFIRKLSEYFRVAPEYFVPTSEEE